MAADSELWDQILKLEQSESLEEVIFDDVELQERLVAIYARLDDLARNETSGA